MNGVDGVVLVDLSAFMGTGSRFERRDGVKALKMWA